MQNLKFRQIVGNSILVLSLFILTPIFYVYKLVDLLIKAVHCLLEKSPQILTQQNA